MAISKAQSIREVVSQHPETVAVFRQHGMGCFGCAAANYENLEEGARAHAIDIELLLSDLNKVISEHAK